ncbi:MAG: polyprenyl synthetase family protein [Candidatus Odinarchaeia archaeon]
MSEEFKNKLKNYAEKINSTLGNFLKNKANEAASLSSANSEFYEEILEFMGRGGKRLRPISLIVSYEGVGAKTEGDIYLASLSVEFLHNSTLIHDDIIDHDEVRRGGPTFHAKYQLKYKESGEKVFADFGIAMGILGGDLTFNLGIETLFASKFPKEPTLDAVIFYQKAFQQVIEGVLLESFMALKGSSTEEQYLKMIHLKTSALFEKSLLIGATLGGGSDAQKRALSKYAILTGQAFQIQDDILGSFGVEEVTGKPSDSDIKEGKQTLLIIKSLELATPQDRQKIKNVLGNKKATPEEIEEVRDIIKNCGALDYAKKLSEKLSENAKKALEAADPPLTVESKKFFEKLSDFVVKRAY